jgi:tryptophan 2,3-dioxygenase
MWEDGESIHAWRQQLSLTTILFASENNSAAMTDRPTEIDMMSLVLQPVADAVRLALGRLDEAKDSAVSWQRYEAASQLRDMETMLLEWRQKLDGLGVMTSPPASEQDDNGKAENRTE